MECVVDIWSSFNSLHPTLECIITPFFHMVASVVVPITATTSIHYCVKVNVIIFVYRCGDLGALIDSQPMLPLPPLTNITNITSDEVAVIEEVETMLYNRLATRRNRRMTKTIDALLKDQRADPVFIAIGAGTHIATHSAQNTDCVPTNNSHTFVYTVEPQIPLGQKEVSLLVRYQVVIWVFGTVKYVFS